MTASMLFSLAIALIVVVALLIFRGGNKAARRLAVEDRQLERGTWQAILAPICAVVGILAGVMFVVSLLAYQDGTYKGGILAFLIQQTIQGGVAAAAVYWLWLDWRHRQQRKKAGAQSLIRALEVARTGELPIASPVHLIMRPSERAFVAVPAKLLEDRAVGYVGGGGSVRVRVTKRVSIGVGGGMGHQERALVTVAIGEFVISDQRAAFAGDRKSFDLPLTKLTNVQALTDCLFLHAGNSSKMIQISDRTTAQIVFAILDRVTRRAS